MTFKVTSINIERGRGGEVRNVFCFQECWKSNFCKSALTGLLFVDLPVGVSHSGIKF